MNETYSRFRSVLSWVTSGAFLATGLCLIAACLRIKQTVVEADEREDGLRRVLNFGHTLGHGIEAAADGALLHGECVGLGMLPMCAPEVRARLRMILQQLGLPTAIHSQAIDTKQVIAAAAHDKKVQATGEIQIVFVPEIGSYQFRRVGPELLRTMLDSLAGKEEPQ